MYHYLFTNDLRISNLEEILRKTGKAFITDTVPSSSENKSENNNMLTLGFYFNLLKESECAKLCAKGNVRDVVLNFIKKFQYPNPRTSEALTDCINDGITLAPMRVILQILFSMNMICPEAAHLSRDEILNFIFYNSEASKTKNINIVRIVQQIIEYRDNHCLPSNVELSPDNRIWKHEERQIREMTKILTWSGCVSENDSNQLYMQFDNLTVENKAALFDILNYNEFCQFDMQKSFSENKKIYQKYMDISDIYHNNEEVNSEGGVTVNNLPERTARDTSKNPLNCIMYGAPGTGKTYSTAEYALKIVEPGFKADNRDEIMKKYREYINSGRIVFTTFHQSYGYEDFIQGLRPNSNSGNLNFEPVDGIFKRIADKAMYDNENDYVIIIDEINRANISKVFGELITLIEDNKRWGEINALSVTLPSGEVFAVPNNLYIIGTMNSADKSISLIDTALRRRFEFVEFVPNAELVTNKLLKEIIIKLNKTLKEEFENTDLLIGHAYFINKSEDDLCDIMNNSVIPLLYEYNYDNAKKVKTQLNEVLKDTDFKISASEFGRIKIEKSDVNA